MDLNDLRTAWTVASFVAFVGIVVWAYSGRRQRQFEEAARLAVDDEPAVTGKNKGEGRVA